MSQIMLVSMLLFFVLTVPVAIAVGLANMAGVAWEGRMTFLVIAQQLYAALDKYPLVAVPFFILAGNLMESGGMSGRMVEFAKSLVGGVQGGLACSCVLTCMIFAAVAGSSVATTFAVGAILIPAMVRHGYPAPFAASLQASAAELGVIIPPSIPMILFAVSTDTSVGELFVAGVGPGLLIGGALMVYVWFYARRHGLGLQDGVGRLSVWPAFRQAWLALLMPVIILGGIYGGIFTPTEASAVAVVYALVHGGDHVHHRERGGVWLFAQSHRDSSGDGTVVRGFVQQSHDVSAGYERCFVRRGHVCRDLGIDCGLGAAVIAGGDAVWH